MQKLMKKFVILLTMIVALSCVNVNGNVVLAKKVTQAQKAKKAYANFLTKNTGAKKKFAVVNLNKDSIPELVIYNGTDRLVYAYINGKLKCIGKEISDRIYLETTFYPSKNLIYSEEMIKNFISISYEKFDGKKVKEVASKEGTYDSSYKYKVEGKKVSAKKYNNYVKQLNLKGKVKKVKVSKIKLVKNTDSNRLKQLGYKK